MPTRSASRRWLTLLAASAVTLPVAAAAQNPAKKDRDVITREELLDADSKSPDLYQAIKRLRAHFLTQNRGINTMGITPGGSSAPMCNDASSDRNCTRRSISNTPVPPVIYLDGMKFGDPESLKGILTRNVAEVRYLSPSKAEMDYGLGHEGGAILVKLFHP
jgi:hypothetical protein